MDQATKKKIKSTLRGVNNKLDKDGVIRVSFLSDIYTGIEVVPSRSYLLDYMLGNGGWPRARIVELLGDETSGKTTLALHAIAATQKMGGVAAFIDAEHALDHRYAEALEVDREGMVISKPADGEEAADTVLLLTETSAFDLIVIDSVDACTPKAILGKDVGDSTVGRLAYLMSDLMRRLSKAAAKTDTCIIFCNQMRDKIGKFSGGSDSPGGRALKFYASQRVKLSNRGRCDENGEKIAWLSASKAEPAGIICEARLIKSKISPANRKVMFGVYYGKGIDEDQDLVNFCLQANILEKAGKSIRIPDGDNVSSSRNYEKAAKAIKNNEELYSQVKEIIGANYGKLDGHSERTEDSNGTDGGGVSSKAD